MVADKDDEVDTDTLAVDVLVGELDKLSPLDNVSDADEDDVGFIEGGAVTMAVGELIELSRLEIEIDTKPELVKLSRLEKVIDTELELVELVWLENEIETDPEGEREIVDSRVVAAAEAETFGLGEIEGEALADGLAYADIVNGSQYL